MIKVKDGYVTMSGEIPELCKDATLLLSAMTMALREKTDNPEQIYNDIVKFGRMDADELEELAKTHDPKEAIQWDEDLN